MILLVMLTLHSTSNLFVVAARTATSPMIPTVFSDRALAAASAGRLSKSSDLNVEVLPLSEAFQLFTDNARQDERYVIDESVNR